MTAEQKTALTIDEMSGIFKALRGDESEQGLQQALDETIALAKNKGLSAADFCAILEGAGIEITDTFRQWLEQKF